MPLDFRHDSFTKQKKQDLEIISWNIGIAASAATIAVLENIMLPGYITASTFIFSSVPLGRAVYLTRQYIKKNREYHEKYPGLKALEDEARRRAKFKNRSLF